MFQMPFNIKIKSGITWIIAFLIAAIILFVAICALSALSWIELPIKKNSEQNIYSTCEGCMFFAEGVNPAIRLNQGLNFLYGSGSDKSRISYALIRSYFSDIFGNGHQPISLLESAGDSPFKFAMKDDENGINWAFSISLFESTDDLIDDLHESFAEQFSPVIIRARTVPSGRIVRDVVADSVGVEESVERFGSYQIRESAHSGSAKTFITALKGNNAVFGNDKRLVMEMVDLEPVSDVQFFASASGFSLFSAAFPDSDVLRYAEGMVSDNDEGYLSLSSWQCIP